MAFDFPSGPSVGDEYESGGVTYAWDGTCWRVKESLPNPTAATYGDVKSGFQPADHAGWIKLDGRAITTLTVTQQTQAIALGFAANLPNATDCGLRQTASDTLGSIGGSVKISLAQLPVHNLSLTALDIADAPAGTSGGFDAAAATTSGWDPGAIGTSSNGAHGHESEAHTGGTTAGFEHPDMAWNKWHTGAQIFNDGAAYTANRKLAKDAGDHSHTVDLPNHTHTVDLPSHTHSVPAHGHTIGGTLPLGGSGTDYHPKALHVNFFCYLGA